MSKAQPLTVFLPDTRGVEVSRFGMGNSKIGFGVFTYSRLAGKSHPYPIAKLPTPGQADTVIFERGMDFDAETRRVVANLGTCPGSTDECEAICYAKRIKGAVVDIYAQNSITSEVPPIPPQAEVVRIHVSGDFDTTAYIESWIARLTERPDVTAWAYTRSWRVPELLPALERLRALPNVQLFASMDQSCPDLPPDGWRRAWIDGDTRAGDILDVTAHADEGVVRNQTTYDGTKSLVCPEETKHKANCVECGYCFEGQKNDVTFLRH